MFNSNSSISVIVVLLLTTFFAVTLYGQNPIIRNSQPWYDIELEQEGLDKEEFKIRMLEEGIDMENINAVMTTTTRPIIQSVVSSMILEKRNAKLNAEKDSSFSKAQMIQKLIEDYPVDTSNGIKYDSLLKQFTNILNPQIEGPNKAEVYGHELFRKNFFHQPSESLDFVTSVPTQYVLGAGDEIVVTIFGRSQYDAKFIIDNDGFIRPTGIPKISLKGQRWDYAVELLKSRFSRFYVFKSEQFAVSLVRPRDITVNIFGEVEKPGSYRISAVNTAFNALNIAGGVTENGSVRKISINSDGIESTLDVYKIIGNPSLQLDFHLQDNAIIQIPAIEKVVALDGAILRPMRYELLATETLHDAIEYAGGLTANAYLDLIQLRRFENQNLELIDINFNSILNGDKKFQLKNGDKVFIKSVSSIANNLVHIEGAVNFPGSYALNSTKQVSDLLTKAILDEKAKSDVAFLRRKNKDGTFKLIKLDLESILKNPESEKNLDLMVEDRLLIHSEERYTDRNFITVNGAVREPLKTQVDPGSSINVEEAIILAGGMKPAANKIAYILRTAIGNRNKKEYIKINVENNANLRLEANDELIILDASNFSTKDSVIISGAVRFPGTFQYDESLKIEDVIRLSGGFLSAAAKNKVEIFRQSFEQGINSKSINLELNDNYQIVSNIASDFKLMPKDEIVVRRFAEYEEQGFVEVVGEVVYPGKYALNTQNESLYTVLQKAGGITSEGSIEGINLKRTVNGIANYKLISSDIQLNNILQSGDTIQVPKKTNYVFIDLQHTSFYNKSKSPERYIGVPYNNGKNAAWYINEYAGGFSNSADKFTVIVQYPNGSAKSSSKKLFRYRYPDVKQGSTIKLHKKQDKFDKDEERSYFPKLKDGVIINLDPNMIMLEKRNKQTDIIELEESIKETDITEGN